MIPNIEKQISALGEEVIKSIQERFTVGDIVPYPYQCVAYAEIAKRMKNYEHPFFVKASVSAGKTLIFAMVAHQCRKMGLKMMVLARQAEIVEQDSEEIANLGVPNSIYCAGLKAKSAYFPIVVGSEGSVVNGLSKALGDYVPHVLGIDECLTGDSMIETGDGELRIDDPNLISRKIKCINESTGEYFYHKPKRVFTNGIRHVSSIKLESGEEIKCTSTHKLYSNGCWVEAGKLQAGMSLSLDGSRDKFTKKLLRASAAVVRKLCRTLVKGLKSC